MNEVTAVSVLELLDGLSPNDVRALAAAGFELADLRDVAAEDEDGPPLVRAAVATYASVPGVVRTKADAERVRLLHLTLHGPPGLDAPLPVPADTPGKFLLWWAGLLGLWAAVVAASVLTQFAGQTGATVALGAVGVIAFGGYAVVMDLKEGFVPSWLRAVPAVAGIAFLALTFTASKSYLALVGKDAHVPLVSARQSAPGENGNHWICQVLLPDGKVREMSSCSDTTVKADSSDAAHPVADVTGLSIDVVYDPDGHVQPHPGSRSAQGAPLALVFGGVGAATLVAGLGIATASAARYRRRT